MVEASDEGLSQQSKQMMQLPGTSADLELDLQCFSTVRRLAVFERTTEPPTLIVAVPLGFASDFEAVAVAARAAAGWQAHLAILDADDPHGLAAKASLVGVDAAYMYHARSERRDWLLDKVPQDVSVSIRSGVSLRDVRIWVQSWHPQLAYVPRRHWWAMSLREAETIRLMTRAGLRLATQDLVTGV